MTHKLTTRQREILDYIIEYRDIHEFPPSTTEIRDRFGFSTMNAVNSHLKALANKRYIYKGPGNRMLRVIRPPQTEEYCHN